MAEKPIPSEEDRDPYAHLWRKLMTDPEIAPPGSWSIKYHGRPKGYEIIVHQYPGFNANKAPVAYDVEIYRKNIARLFERIGRALEREDQSPGDVPPVDVLKKFLPR